MRDFRKLDIWKNGIALVKKVYQLTEKLPPEEKFGLKSQITRAAVSVPSNIAEGCGRSSEIEFIKPSELEIIFSMIEMEAKMINSLIRKIKNG